MSVDSDVRVAIILGFALCSGQTLVIALSRFMSFRDEGILVTCGGVFRAFFSVVGDVCDPPGLQVVSVICLAAGGITSG